MPTVQATISAGTSLSNVADCSTANPVFLGMPAVWTQAPISILISGDGTTFYELVDARGNELLFNWAPGGGMPFESDYAQHINYIKIRSGSKVHPVVQPVDAVFNIVMS
jgi:hypothetical protein